MLHILAFLTPDSHCLESIPLPPAPPPTFFTWQTPFRLLNAHSNESQESVYNVFSVYIISHHHTDYNDVPVSLFWPVY